MKIFLLPMLSVYLLFSLAFAADRSFTFGGRVFDPGQKFDLQNAVESQQPHFDFANARVISVSISGRSFGETGAVKLWVGRDQSRGVDLPSGTIHIPGPDKWGKRRWILEFQIAQIEVSSITLHVETRGSGPIPRPIRGNCRLNTEHRYDQYRGWHKYFSVTCRVRGRGARRYEVYANRRRGSHQIFSGVLNSWENDQGFTTNKRTFRRRRPQFEVYVKPNRGRRILIDTL